MFFFLFFLLPRRILSVIFSHAQIKGYIPDTEKEKVKYIMHFTAAQILTSL